MTDTLRVIGTVLIAACVVFVPTFVKNLAKVVHDYKHTPHEPEEMELKKSDPMIVPEPGWSYFHWDELVYQDRPLILKNRGGGDAKSVRIADMSNKFGKATFREIGFIASNDAESINPSVENYDSAPMIKMRDLAHLVDAEYSPFGPKEGSIRISIEYKDVNNNRFLTTGRIVREQTNAHHQFKDLKFRRVT